MSSGTLVEFQLKVIFQQLVFKIFHGNCSRVHNIDDLAQLAYRNGGNTYTVIFIYLEN